MENRNRSLKKEQIYGKALVQQRKDTSSFAPAPAGTVVADRTIVFRKPHAGIIPPAFLFGIKAIRTDSLKRAHSLEPQRMNHGQVIKTLNVETNRRYRPTDTSTFCNVAAHDYATLWGAYIPRVWWTKMAIDRMTRGEKLRMVYGNGISLELNANALFDWFVNWGHRFGYSQQSEKAAQELVDKGGFAIIVAKNNVLTRSGHISVILPSDMGEDIGEVPGNPNVPLQWNAGRRNQERFRSQWYRNSKTFSSFLIYGIKP